jgi:hypothetical protein
LRRCQRVARDQLNDAGFVSTAIGLLLMLVAFVTCGLTMTMTYSEEFFMVLLLPVCLERAIDYALAQQRGSLAGPVSLDAPGAHVRANQAPSRPLSLNV